MDLVFCDLKKKEFRLRVATLDDLWHLSHFLSVGDVVIAKDERKVRLGDADAKSRVVRKVFSLSVRVERVTFAQDVLEVVGTVVDGSDEVASGSYHTFRFAVGDTFFVTKSKLLAFQKKHLDDACSSAKSTVLLVALDREVASFGLLQGYGLAFLGEISGNVAKKRAGHMSSGDFYADVVAEISSYVDRYGLSTVVIGSPAFWKDEIYKRLGSVNFKVVLATCHHTGKVGLQELLRRSEVQRALSFARLQQDVALVTEFLSVLRTDPGLVCYGLVDVSSAVSLGAVKVLLVTDTFIASLREDERYAELDAVLENCEKSSGAVHIVSGASDSGAQLDGLGGVVCVLRYRLG